MLMRNITLPTGPYDWDPARLPLAIGEARLASLRALCAKRSLAGVVLTGSTFDDGALVWATGFTPKLGAAFALLPVRGDPRLLFSGGPGMKPSAEKLTWLRDVAALRSPGADIAAFIKPGGRWGFCDNAGLSRRDRAALATAGADDADLTADIARLRRLPDAAVDASAARAKAILRELEAGLRDDFRARAGRFEAALAAEALARRAGAQDLRLRLSTRENGPAEPVDPSPALLPPNGHFAIALRVEGLWLCVRSGTDGRDPRLAARWRAWLTPLADGACHRPGRDVTVAPLGYSIVEPLVPADDRFRAGQLIVATVTGEDHAASAIVRIEADGGRVLWAAPALSGDLS